MKKYSRLGGMGWVFLLWVGMKKWMVMSGPIGGLGDKGEEVSGGGGEWG